MRAARIFETACARVQQNEGRSEQMRVYSAAGKLLAKGSCFDGMAGFSWE